MAEPSEYRVGSQTGGVKRMVEQDAAARAVKRKPEAVDGIGFSLALILVCDGGVSRFFGSPSLFFLEKLRFYSRKFCFGVARRRAFNVIASGIL